MKKVKEIETVGEKLCGIHLKEVAMNKERLVRRAKPEDAQAIWNLYLETGFLYKEKLEAMGDRGFEALANLEALLKLDSDDYCISLCTDERGKILSACTYARFSDTEGWQMHLASAHDSQGLGFAIEATGTEFLASDAQWMSYTFRENNRSVRRLFNSACKGFNDEVGNAVYDYYIFSARQTELISQLNSAITIRKATEEERLELLASLSNSSDKVALEAVGSLTDGMSVKELAERLARQGLVRQREAFVATICGEPVGIAVADLSPKWWNFSNLSTGVRLFLQYQNEEVVRGLLAAAAKWFCEHSVDSWTLLVGDEDSALRSVLATPGLSSHKRYERIEAPAGFVPFITKTYVDLVRRAATRSVRDEFVLLPRKEEAVVCAM
jgi:hypothetical protein